MAYSFSLPGKTVMGIDALTECEATIKQYGKKALIVTGKTTGKTEAAKILFDSLVRWGMEYSIYDGITGEPTIEMIKGGVDKYKAERCDFLIGIGGGSPLDSVKAIAALSVLGGSPSDYMGRMMEGNFPKMVLIPTTAGTGSEATKFAVITDTDKGVKMLLKGESLLPDLAIVDPHFALTMPRSITMGTGIDALTHAVESFISRKATPMTDLYALDAIKRIFRYLTVASEDGVNFKAREELAIAAYEAGVCINNASVTIVHGMSRPFGALFHIPHGFSNAILLEKCMRFVADGCIDKFAEIARAIGASTVDDSNDKSAKAFLDALNHLCKELKIPTLSDFSVDKSEFLSKTEKMAEDALASGSPQNSLKTVTKEDILSIYHQLF